jgi:hypothetical protein
MLLIVTSVVVVSGVLRDRPTAVSNGSDIVLRWSTLDESGVERFDILRRAGTEGAFLLIGSERPKGNNSAYEYVDQQVFKSAAGIYQYKIRIVDGSPQPPESDVITVSHLSSAYKRTWGSIKAMFR